MSKGLRQDDSFPHFLLIIAADVLSKMVVRAEDKGFLQGFLVGNPNWMGIGGGIKDHFDTVLRAFSKQVSVRFDIEVEILALLEGLL
uniref:Uncharacterized protein n=1 Tax=Vitis vinifera TaxID=29760 RepID=A5B9Y4_VITVI|nr:hypothetical protein VITISV_017104 [Vitis vinifera]